MILGSMDMLSGRSMRERQLFSSVKFIHEHRDSNTDAHRIARSSIHVEVGWHVWFLNPPDGVCNMYNPQI